MHSFLGTRSEAAISVGAGSYNANLMTFDACCQLAFNNVVTQID
jgi:hypothetical protein